MEKQWKWFLKTSPEYLDRSSFSGTFTICGVPHIPSKDTEKVRKVCIFLYNRQPFDYMGFPPTYI